MKLSIKNIREMVVDLGVSIQVYGSIRGGKFSFVLNRIGWKLRGY